MKQYKVWIEIEEYDEATDKYVKHGDPLDLEVKDQEEAYRLQTTLHSIGEDIQAYYSGLERIAQGGQP